MEIDCNHSIVEQLDNQMIRQRKMEEKNVKVVQSSKNMTLSGRVFNI